MSPTLVVDTDAGVVVVVVVAVVVVGLLFLSLLFLSNSNSSCKIGRCTLLYMFEYIVKYHTRLI